MRQSELFGVGVPYEPHSEASRLAAERIAPYVGGARYRVWRYIVDHPRCTDQQIRDDLNMNIKTVSPRRIELEKQGLIRPDGLVKNRPLEDAEEGAEATAWIATGVPYPERWPRMAYTFARRRAERPTADEFKIAVADMREAWRMFKESGQTMRPETVRVMAWLARQAEKELRDMGL